MGDLGDRVGQGPGPRPVPGPQDILIQCMYPGRRLGQLTGWAGEGLLEGRGAWEGQLVSVRPDGPVAPGWGPPACPLPTQVSGCYSASPRISLSVSSRTFFQALLDPLLPPPTRSRAGALGWQKASDLTRPRSDPVTSSRVSSVASRPATTTQGPRPAPTRSREQHASEGWPGRQEDPKS